MKVFFLSYCLSVKSGFIFGWKIELENIFVVLIVIYLFYKLVKLYIFCERVEQFFLFIFGVWLNESDEYFVFEVLVVVEIVFRLLFDELIILWQIRNFIVFQLYFVVEKLRFGLNGFVVILYK